MIVLRFAIPNLLRCRLICLLFTVYLSCVMVREPLLAIQRFAHVVSVQVPWRWCVLLFTVCWCVTLVNASCWCASLQVAWLVLVETELTATYYLSFTLRLLSLWPWVLCWVGRGFGAACFGAVWVGPSRGRAAGNWLARRMGHLSRARFMPTYCPPVKGARCRLSCHTECSSACLLPELLGVTHSCVKPDFAWLPRLSA